MILRKTGHRYDKKLGKLPDALAHMDMKTILRRKGMFTHKTYNHQLKESVKPMIREMLKSGKTAEEAEAIASEAIEEQISPSFTNEVIMAFYDKQIHTVDVLEDAFRKAIEKFIKKLEDQALHKFDSQLANKSVRAIKSYITKDQFDLFDDEDIKTQAQIDLTPLLMNEIVIAGQAAYDLIGKEDVYIPYDVTRAVQKNVAKFTQSMLDTDRDTLSKLIIDGLNEGLSVPEIRNNMTASFENISKKQSTLITRTEVMRAANMGNLDAFQQSGVVEAKQWLTAGATDECAAYEGQTETLDGNFYETSEFADGDPPLHPNCRCVLIPVVVGEKSIIISHDQKLIDRIKELEEQADKRTKGFKELQALRSDDKVYIKSLEKYLRVEDEPTDEA